MRHPFTHFLAASLVALVGCVQSGGENFDTNQDRIVGGVEAQPGAWPGTVALYMGNMQACGGALVADSWVLTAGHCILNPSSPTGGISKVVIGRHTLSTTDGETRTVDRAIRHARFNRSTLDNDLALLHLSEPSTAPKSKLLASTQAAQVVADAEVTVVGWGDTRESGSTSDVLREVTIPIISNAQCKTYPRYDKVTENQICAGLPGGSKDSCQGDSGGPLFEKIDGAYVQVGLVSWGIGCARANAPGVYTRLGNYLGWLAEQTNGDVGEVALPEDGGAPDGGDTTDGGTTTDGGDTTSDAGPAPDAGETP